MIEVQVITFGDENENWLKECLKGLESPVVNIHHGGAIHGHINAARMGVWDRCGGDLLSFVDPDDIPLAGTWEKLQKLMDDNPNAGGCYALEDRITADGRPAGGAVNTSGQDPARSPLVAHHMLVVRRRVYDMIVPFLRTQAGKIEWMLAVAAYNRGGLLCLPEVGYHWRQHSSNGGRRFPYPINLPRDLLKWMDQRHPKI